MSASQVLDAREQHLLVIPTGTRLEPLKGDILRIFAETSKTVADDFIDVSVVRLHPDLQALLPSGAFLRWAELDHSTRGPTRDAFGVSGYPLTKQRNGLKGTDLTARTYELAAEECPAKIYATSERNPALSLMIGFEKRRVWGPDGVREMPNLQGMSGCGVWRYGPSMRTTTAPPRLAGIAVEWYPKGRHPYILATRISVVIAALTQRHSDVREAVLDAVAGAR
jgi:hypothetical protein